MCLSGNGHLREKERAKEVQEQVKVPTATVPPTLSSSSSVIIIIIIKWQCQRRRRRRVLIDALLIDGLQLVKPPSKWYDYILEASRHKSDNYVPLPNEWGYACSTVREAKFCIAMANEAAKK